MSEDTSDEGATDGREELAWETLGRETDYTCPGFSVRRDEVRLPDGTETEYHSLEEGESVVVLPFTPAGEVVIIEEWRQSVERINRGLPAGSVEETDTDLAAAAVRELEEETGYTSAEVTRLRTVEPANGVSDSVFHYFVARGCEPSGEQDLDYNESIRVETTTFPDLREEVRDGSIRDGRTAFGVLYYHAFGED